MKLAPTHQAPSFLSVSIKGGLGLASHVGTGISTALTGFGAELAMRHGMRGTLSSAAFARLGAQRTYRLHVVVSAGDRRRCEAAHISACEVKLNTSNHCLAVLLLQASAGALKAGCGTFVAGKKAFFLDLTKHLNLHELSSTGKSMIALTSARVCAFPHPAREKT